MGLTTTLVAIAGGMALGLSLGACSAEDVEAGLSREQLARRADAICAATAVAAEHVPVPHRFGLEIASTAAYYVRIAPLIRRETQLLTALHPGDESDPDWQRFLVRQRQLTTWLEDVRRRVAARDPAVERSMAEMLAVPAVPADVARRVGAPHCAT